MSQHRPSPGTSVQSPPQALLTHSLSSIANAIFITDRTGRIVWANQAFGRLCGYSPEELVDQTPSLLKSGMQSESFYIELWRTVLSGKVWRGLIVDRRKDGTLYTADETITPLADEQGIISHFIAIQNDVSLPQRDHDRDHYLAYHDPLTGLPNRAMFVDLQRQAISDAKRKGRPLAILFLDLDKFKPVNDTFGHDIGDRLLLAVAERLRAAVRKSDTVARFGGDEFAVLLPDVPDASVAIALAGKLAESLARPFVIQEKRIQIGASVGIALYPDHGDGPAELIRKADQAMYLAKKRGGNTFQLPSDQVA